MPVAFFSCVGKFIQSEGQLISELENFILSTIKTIYEALGWLGVSGLLVFENATGITPSEIILGLAGWVLIAEHQLPPSMIFLGGFYSAVGSTIGASITYWVARLGGRPLIDKISGWFRISSDQIIRVETQFHRWGPGLVFIGRMIPGIRTLISIPAGLARMPFITFLIATFSGAYIWCSLLIGAGYVLGHEWSLISTYLKQALPYIISGGAVAFGFYLWFTRRSLAPKYIPVKSDDN